MPDKENDNRWRADLAEEVTFDDVKEDEDEDEDEDET